MSSRSPLAPPTAGRRFAYEDGPSPSKLWFTKPELVQLKRLSALPDAPRAETAASAAGKRSFFMPPIVPPRGHQSRPATYNPPSRNRGALCRDMDSVWDRPAFAMGARTWTWQDVAAAAILRDDWSALVEQVRAGLALVGLAD